MERSSISSWKIDMYTGLWMESSMICEKMAGESLGRLNFAEELKLIRWKLLDAETPLTRRIKLVALLSYLNEIWTFSIC